MNTAATASAAIDIAALRAQIGRTAEADDVVTPVPANLQRLSFDRPGPELREGDTLPTGWHGLYFLPRFTAAELTPDGAPRDNGVIPAMPLPRRMFAGETVTFHRPLHIGERIRRVTELTDISARTGGTGALIFATVTHRISGESGLAIEEERLTVFREATGAGAANREPRRDPVPADVPWRRTVTPDPVLLFRFSSLTFNSHRIHYDHVWATQVEGYRGLVVHGPLTTLLLVNFMVDSRPDRRLRAYSLRARAPLFADRPFELRGRPEDPPEAAAFWAVTPEGTVGTEVRARYD